ncbi:hypothetical protein SAMN03159494_02042 [Achromobacter sp. NFACC18-2]|nr:hypothetical protein SAMN03159494_02042 [Achromobacter sp. NFACC18-2]
MRWFMHFLEQGLPGGNGDITSDRSAFSHYSANCGTFLTVKYRPQPDKT